MNITDWTDLKGTEGTSQLTETGRDYAFNTTDPAVNAGTPDSLPLGLDHSDEHSGPFEGPEKLLELWFDESPEAVELRGGPRVEGCRQPGNYQFGGLRQIPRPLLEDMLDLVHCKVLNHVQGDQVDAYLLSESSMFVWPHKMILKTCGTTTLLYGLPKILQLAKMFCGFGGVWRCFYSRKSFMFPERQQGPHRDWTAEVDYLNRHFQNGAAYTVGRTNGEHWFLFMTPAQEGVLPPNRPLIPTQSDQTFEILMSKLSPRACQQFYNPEESTNLSEQELGTQLSDNLGLSSLLPEAKPDAYLFTPCGFSSNYIRNERYATIHVTPEYDYSYASFESNIDFSPANAKLSKSRGGPASWSELLERVLKVFEPSQLCMTLFESTDEQGGASGIESTASFSRTLLSPAVASQYTQRDRIVYEFGDYRLLFCCFEKLI